MATKYQCYQEMIKSIIGVKKENRCSVSDIINHSEFVVQAEHRGIKDFNKAIYREIRKIIDDLGFDDQLGSMILVEEKPTHKGQRPTFYWASSSLKNVNTGKEEISDELRMARAITYQFVDEYLREFLPPSIVQTLEDDMDEAHQDLLTRQFWQKKLQFHPSGFDLKPNPEITTSNRLDWNQVYDALNSSMVIKADYRSLHKGIVPDTVHLSLQKIQYSNHKVMVLAYVHELNVVKTFEVARLKNISLAPQCQFKEVDMLEYETRYELKARVNVGVKDYFTTVNFGHNFKAKQEGNSECWIITTSIKIPEHFSKEKERPDPFLIANFLSGFGDSIEVLAPSFLRDEMMRRVNNLTKLYSADFDSTQVLSNSPHEQTGNSNALI